jgi:hypothetical protein
MHSSNPGDRYLLRPPRGRPPLAGEPYVGRLSGDVIPPVGGHAVVEYPRARETPNDAWLSLHADVMANRAPSGPKANVSTAARVCLPKPGPPDRASQEGGRVHCSQRREVIPLQPLVSHQLTVQEDSEAQCPRLGAPTGPSLPVGLVHPHPSIPGRVEPVVGRERRI